MPDGGEHLGHVDGGDGGELFELWRAAWLLGEDAVESDSMQVWVELEIRAGPLQALLDEDLGRADVDVLAGLMAERLHGLLAMRACMHRLGHQIELHDALETGGGS